MLPATIVTAASSISRQHSIEVSFLPTALFRRVATRGYKSLSFTGFAMPPKPLSDSPAGLTSFKSIDTLTTLELKLLSLLNSRIF